jgi:hypothetical protein
LINGTPNADPAPPELTSGGGVMDWLSGMFGGARTLPTLPAEPAGPARDAYAGQSMTMPRADFRPGTDIGGSVPMSAEQADRMREASMELHDATMLAGGPMGAEAGTGAVALASRRTPVNLPPPSRGLINAAGEAPGFTSYHGSGAKFDRFDDAFIGTGEGAQAYGMGHYTAGAEPTAETYVQNANWSYGRQKAQTIYDNLHNQANERGLDNEGWSRLNAQREFWENVVLGRSPRQLIEDAKANPDQWGQHYLDYVNTLNPDRFRRVGGNMYEVNINADPEHYLNWDKPLSEQHPVVQKAMADRFDLRPGGVQERAAYLASLPNDDLRAVATRALDNPNITGDAPEFARLMKEAPDIDHNAVWDIQRAALHPEGWGSYSRQPTTMGDLYRSNYLGDPTAASAALQEAGIPGIRYLDSGSRQAGEGTHNYVTFSPSIMAIIRRYGIAGLISGAGAAAGTQDQTQ